MPNDDKPIYRKREASDDILIFEQPQQTMPQVAGLKLDTSFDVSKLGGFTAPEVKLGSVAEKIKPQGVGTLQIGTDLGKLDAGIERIKHRQTTAEIQALIQEAEQLIAKKQYRPAIKPLDKAISRDAACLAALCLKGYCLYNLEEYDPAMKVLEEARRHARDSESALSVLMLQALCMRAMAAQVEAKLAELVKAKKYVQALSLIEGELNRYPDAAALLYHKCGVLLMMGRMADAGRTARYAIERVENENAELFYELLDEIRFQENLPYLEAAREALRRKEAEEAIRQLEACRSALIGKAQYEAIWAYAQEKRPRGFFSKIFSGGTSAALDPATRQVFLQWLLAEELGKGMEAMGKEKYDIAVGLFSQAARIDGNCHIICFLHAVALFNGFNRAIENKKNKPDLDRAVSDLEQAAQLLQQAGVNPLVAKQCADLLQVVNNYLGQLRSVKRESSAVNECVTGFTSMMDHFTRNPISNRQELETARSMVKELKSKVAKARTKQPRGSEGWKVLDQVDEALRNVEKQLYPH